MYYLNELINHQNCSVFSNFNTSHIFCLDGTEPVKISKTMYDQLNHSFFQNCSHYLRTPTRISCAMRKVAEIKVDAEWIQLLQDFIDLNKDVFKDCPNYNIQNAQDITCVVKKIIADENLRNSFEKFPSANSASSSNFSPIKVFVACFVLSAIISGTASYLFSKYKAKQLPSAPPVGKYQKK